jgi:hypothetical protein
VVRNGAASVEKQVNGSKPRTKQNLSVIPGWPQTLDLGEGGRCPGE